MTIRSKVEEESPDGRVLYIEDLRHYLGIRTVKRDFRAESNTLAPVGSTKPSAEVLLIGHDLRGDFPKMRAEGINFDSHLHYSGCIDTYVVIKDTGKEGFGESLSRIMAHYGIAGGRMVK